MENAAATLAAPAAAPAANAATEAGPLLVVAGASNLHLGLVPLARALDRAIGASGPLLVAAPGAGRSYGAPAGFLGLQYPGLVHAGIPAFVAPHRERGRRVALLMDIGNALGYGEEPETILRWVGALAAELRAAGFPVLVQRPPVESVARLSPLRFSLIKGIYFPRARLSRAELLARVRAVDDGLASLERDGCEIIGSVAPYAGPDGIHVRPWNLPAFWDGLASELVRRVGLSVEARLGHPVTALASGLRARVLRPRRYRDNPAHEMRLPHGTTLVRL